jgi:hypothetical protein
VVEQLFRNDRASTNQAFYERETAAFSCLVSSWSVNQT